MNRTSASSLSTTHACTTKFARFCLPLTLLSLIGCGGSGNSGSVPSNVNRDVPISIAVSDAAVESAQSVVVQLDEITFVDENGNTERFERFYDENSGEHSRETVSIDLLQYQGENALEIIRGQNLDPDTYTQINLKIRNDTLNDSYVINANGEQVRLDVPEDTLQLPGFTLRSSDANSTWVIEFDLRTALTFDATPQARYTLNARGIRIQNEATSATLSGTLDLNTLNAQANCGNPQTGNVLYLYEAGNFDLSLSDTEATRSFVIPPENRDSVLPLLADQFDAETASGLPAGAIAPFSSIHANTSGEYTLAFLPAGGYILAYSCTAEADAPDTFDNITLTDYPEQLMYVYLEAAEREIVNLP